MPPSKSYTPAAGSTTDRGRRRRDELLQIAVDYLLTEGLGDFSLRQIAKRAGTSHRMLVYHFGSNSQLLRAALTEIRRPYLARAEATPDLRRLARQVFAADSPAERVLLQGLLLAGLDPAQYSDIGRDYADAYLPIVKRHLPDRFTGRTRDDAAQLVLCAFRGAMLDAHTTGDAQPARRALALLQALATPSAQ